MCTLCCNDCWPTAPPGKYLARQWKGWHPALGCVECQLVVEYLKVKKQELPNEEETPAHAAAASRHAELHQAMDGLTCIEGPLFKKRREDLVVAAHGPMHAIWVSGWHTKVSQVLVVAVPSRSTNWLGS